jgi:peptide chain release factor 1
MDISPLIEKMRSTFKDVEQQLADPTVFDDRKKAEALTREHQWLSTLLTSYDDLVDCRQQLADNQEMLASETDEEFLMEIEADVKFLETRIERLDTKVMGLILPPDPIDSRNTIVEIRPAAGGDEAALFAGDLYRMYSRFAERCGWKVDVLTITETDLGGIKEVSFSLAGQDVYKSMRFESGVHRVQRIPTTETSGRIHTSTVTVAVLPEAEEVDVQIKTEDPKFDVFRASGAGGQHVNTTDSAVRVTHIPSGVSVESQQERSQHRNREIALRILRSRMLEAKVEAEQAAYAAERKSQVGSGDRSERIRTYNFPQNRVTDHRYGLSWYNLPGTLDGDITDMLEAILAKDSIAKLEEQLNDT